MPHFNITGEAREKFKRMALRGATAKELADEFKVDQKVALRFKKRLGIEDHLSFPNIKMSVEDRAEFIRLALEGTVPEELATKFNLSKGTVHNYKKKISEEEGIVFPNVRGKRTTKKSALKNDIAGQEAAGGADAQASIKGKPETRTIMLSEYIIVTVGGIEVLVSKGAKSISVHPTSVVIDC